MAARCENRGHPHTNSNNTTEVQVAGKQLITAIAPPKPIKDMTDEEKAKFVNDVVRQIAHKSKPTGEGK